MNLFFVSAAPDPQENSAYHKAIRDLNEQDERGAQCFFSLSSMWRAAKCPAGRAPSLWYDSARELCAGYARYYDALDDHKSPDLRPLVGGKPCLFFACPAELADDELDHREGDFITPIALAFIYALFLNGREDA